MDARVSLSLSLSLPPSVDLSRSLPATRPPLHHAPNESIRLTSRDCSAQVSKGVTGRYYRLNIHLSKMKRTKCTPHTTLTTPRRTDLISIGVIGSILINVGQNSLLRYEY